MRINRKRFGIKSTSGSSRRVNQKKINGLNNKIRDLEEFQSNYQKSVILQESYGKRLNILVHCVRENQETVWETSYGITKFKDFFYYELKICGHGWHWICRLTQHPVKRDGKIINRPIIDKLLTMHNKNQIFSAVKNLKLYNAQRKLENENYPYIYITEHLSAKFQSQCKKLIKSKVFEEAKKHRQKVRGKQ